MIKNHFFEDNKYLFWAYDYRYLSLFSRLAGLHYLPQLHGETESSVNTLSPSPTPNSSKSHWFRQHWRHWRHSKRFWRIMSHYDESAGTISQCVQLLICWDIIFTFIGSKIVRRHVATIKNYQDTWTPLESYSYWLLLHDYIRIDECMIQVTDRHTTH